MREKLRVKLLIFLRIFVGVSLIFIVFKVIPYKKLVYHLGKANLYILGGAFLVFFFIHLLGVFRWKIILQVLDLNVKYKDLFFLFFSGLFLNLIFPSLLAQDAFRGGLLSLREPKSLKRVTASLVIDRFSGFLALSAIALTSFGLGRNLIRERTVSFAIFLLAFIVGFCFLFIFSRQFFKGLLFFFKRFKKIEIKLQEFHNYLYIFRKELFSFSKIFLISLIIQILMVLIFYMVGLSFGIDTSIIFYFILVPIIMVVANLPLTSAGLGTREVAAIYFFSKVGIESSVALGISLMNFFFIIILGLMGGMLYVAFYSRWLQSYKQDTNY